MRAKRNYKKEYHDFHAKPKQKKERAARNLARAHAVKDGRAHKGDGKDVHHKDNNPLNNSPGNTVVMSNKSNQPRRKKRNS